MSTTYCSICSKPVFGDNGAIGDIVDLYKYDFDGTLDYILLMHRACAKRKGYKIVGDTVVTGHWAEKSLKSEHIVKHGSGYRLVSHKGKNLGDFPTRAAAAKHEGEVEYFKKHEETELESQQLQPNIRTEAMPEPGELNPIKEGYRYIAQRVPMTLDFVVVDTDTGRRVGSIYRERDYASEGPQVAANRDAADLNRMIGHMHKLHERYETTCPKCKKPIERQGGSNERCPKCGGELPYESNWTRATRKENSDAAPAISRMEGTVVKKFGNTILEMEDPKAKPKKLDEVTPPGKESWVKANKARFKKEYGDKKGTEVLYATAWKNKNESIRSDKVQSAESVNEAFTRQHYVMIAKLIKEMDDEAGSDIGDPSKAIFEFANKLADLFKQDNPRFDKGYFLSACGL